MRWIASLIMVPLLVGSAAKADPADHALCQQQDDKAITACLRIVADKKQSAQERAWGLMMLGNIRDTGGDPDGAISDYDQASALDPGMRRSTSIAASPGTKRAITITPSPNSRMRSASIQPMP